MGPRTSFVQRYGGILFFMAIFALGGVEVAWQKATGFKVRGVGGFLWLALSMGPIMLTILWDSWYPTFATKGIPGPGSWGWQRWLTPMVCALPDFVV